MVNKMTAKIYKQFFIYTKSSDKTKRQQIRQHIFRLANEQSPSEEPYETDIGDSDESLGDNGYEEDYCKIPAHDVSPTLKGLVDAYEDGLIENTLPEEMFFMAPNQFDKINKTKTNVENDMKTVRPQNKRANISYPAIVTREGNKYLARFPHAPGCQTFAYSIPKLRKNAQEALEGWLLTVKNA